MIDRPDLLTKLSHDRQMQLDIVFAALYVLTIIRLAWQQIAEAHLPWQNGFSIVMRNVLAISAGVGLLVYVSHLLLHGIDHTGHRQIW
ncbi:MAG: hypothetical protein P4L66_11470 [Acetobacteraceae bacterium]|nr:hypothetical protein [Acetobacteraceae bacterium]